MISVIIPALDEERTIGPVIASVRRALAGRRHEIIVVDSSPGTATAVAARRAGAKVLTERRLGYGRAYLTGFEASRGEILVMIDADGTYPAELVGKMADALHKEGADVLMGSRFLGRMQAGAMPAFMRAGNRAITLATNLLFGCRLTDSQSGFRIIGKKALKAMAPSAEGMEFASELNVRAARLRLKVVEVPIDYRQRRGASKLRPVSDGLRHFAFLFRERFCRANGQ